MQACLKVVKPIMPSRGLRIEDDRVLTYEAIHSDALL
jgi:hypothetical protein